MIKFAQRSLSVIKGLQHFPWWIDGSLMSGKNLICFLAAALDLQWINFVSFWWSKAAEMVLNAFVDGSMTLCVKWKVKGSVRSEIKLLNLLKLDLNLVFDTKIDSRSLIIWHWHWTCNLLRKEKQNRHRKWLLINLIIVMQVLFSVIANQRRLLRMALNVND